jgi:tRNA(fMet)-specific endonuclease VapC
MESCSSVTEPLYLLDSNICIYLLEGLSERARDRVQACAPHEIITSSIVYAEVVRGLDFDDDRAVAVVSDFFDIIDVRPFDRVAAEAYRHVPFRRARFDRLIAAHALSLDLTLVTNNIADFADIPGLRVENWTQ